MSFATISAITSIGFPLELKSWCAGGVSLTQAFARRRGAGAFA